MYLALECFKNKFAERATWICREFDNELHYAFTHAIFATEIHLGINVSHISGDMLALPATVNCEKLHIRWGITAITCDDYIKWLLTPCKRQRCLTLATCLSDTWTSHKTSLEERLEKVSFVAKKIFFSSMRFYLDFHSIQTPASTF